MDVTVVFLLASTSGFLLGYLFGHRDLKFEKLLGSLSNFKESLVSKFTPRQKLVILNSKDVLPDLEDEEEEPIT